MLNKILKYMLMLIILAQILPARILNASTINSNTINHEAISKAIVLKNILTSETKDQKNKSQESFLNSINQKPIDQELEFVSPDESDNITKAGGNVTTAIDFSAINKIVKTANTTVGVAESGVTIDGSNNISGVNTLNATGISLPASSASTPAITFPGASTNTGIYSGTQDTVSISSAGNNLVTFGPTGITIAYPSGTSLAINNTTLFNNPATFNSSVTFSGPITLAGQTTINGITNLGSTGSTTTINGTVNINNTANFTGQTNLNGQITINAPLTIITTTTIPASQLTLEAGSAGAPSLTFNGDTTTGIYQPTSGQVAITAQGAQRMLIATGAVIIAANNTLTIPATTSPTPALNFTGNLTTGISATGDTISFETAGAERLSLSSTGIAKFSATGSATNPTIQIGGTNTGIYSASANTLSFCASGADKILLNSTGVTVSAGNTLTVPIGTPSAPSIVSNFSNNYGIDFSSTGTINICNNGTSRLNIFNNGVQLFTRIAPTQNLYEPIVQPEVKTMTLTPAGYDVYPFKAANYGTSIDACPGYPVGTLKMIYNVKDPLVDNWFVGFFPNGALNACAASGPLSTSYVFLLPPGHAAILMCVDSANGYWVPFAGY